MIEESDIISFAKFFFSFNFNNKKSRIKIIAFVE